MTQNKIAQKTNHKSTRAFRTISEAADELDLQSHVLRFWESKFSDIQPMKRRGGRRFYRPEDIEFLRGIKVLLHREKHPIKDVQKLIRIRGPHSVRELGRSVEQASKPREVKDTVLVPKRIKPVADKPVVVRAKPEPIPEPVAHPDPEIVRRPGAEASVQRSTPTPTPVVAQPDNSGDNVDLEDALSRLKGMKSRWQKFT